MRSTRLTAILAFVIQCLWLVEAQQNETVVPAPVSFAPSQNWDGDDGSWSSFTIRVGTPAQDVRVFISTATEETWVVLPLGCATGDTPCPDARGQLFSPNASSTWSQQGYYQLDIERNLDVTGDGEYGNDTLGLGIQGSNGPTLKNQVIGGIATDNYYLGMFGVNPKPTNFTNDDSGQASYMTSLKDQNLIPSLSFGYTAGAPYRLKKVLGSLTLGGYDQSRFTSNSLSFTFAPDNSRDIVVGIQSIISVNQDGTSNSLLPSGILAYVDSTVSQIWLPLEACQAFEKVFGLTYDDATELYLVNDTLHDSLVAQNTSITFGLGNTETGGQTINLTLPYDSFDLSATSPFVPNATRYFPLRRAANDTQYTLGRTFLQETYLIVDWERNNFSLSQCVFNENAAEQIVAIQSVNASSNGTTSGPVKPSSSNHGEIIGIAVGVALVIVFLASGSVTFLVLQKRKKARAAANATKTENDTEDTNYQGLGNKAELDTDQDHSRFEMNGDGPMNPGGPETPPTWIDEKAIFPGDRSDVVELTGNGQDVPELPGQKGFLRPVHEMYDESAATAPVELPADMPTELQGSTPSLASPSSAASSPIFRSANQSPVNRSIGPSPLNRSTANPSPLNRFSGITSQSRSSTIRSHPSQSSAPSPPTQSSGVPSPANRAMTTLPPGNDVFSPISPLGEGGQGESFSLLSQSNDPPQPSRARRGLGSQRRRQDEPNT